MGIVRAVNEATERAAAARAALCEAQGATEGCVAVDAAASPVLLRRYERCMSRVLHLRLIAFMPWARYAALVWFVVQLMYHQERVVY